MAGRSFSTLVVALTLLTPLSAGATDVPGGPVSGIWDLPGSPYNILGDITVPAAASLTIEPGVEVIFHGAFDLTAVGTISAVGTVADTIDFTGIVEWAGIRLENEVIPSRFEFCSIAGAETGFRSINSPVEVVDCHFANHVTAINVYGIGNPIPAAVTISGTRIEACQNHGIFIVENSNTTIEDCEITQCALSGSPRGAIQLSNQSIGGSNHPTIRNNWIHHNIWQGLTAFDLTGGTHIAPLIEGNTIEYNLTGIYLLYASGRLVNNQINHNFVAGDPNSGAGVMVSGATSQPILTDNTLTGNFTALYVIEGAAPNLGDLNNASTDDDGRNQMYDNVDPGGNTWSVYSNSTADIMAENNSWDSDNYAEIAATIFDGNENPAYGIVDFDPILDTSAITEAVATPQSRPSGLLGNHPNPFRPTTTIRWETSPNQTGETTTVKIYSVTGHFIRTLFVGRSTAGVHSTVWDGTNHHGIQQPSGCYICQLTTGTRTDRQQVILIR